MSPHLATHVTTPCHMLTHLATHVTTPCHQSSHLATCHHILPHVTTPCHMSPHLATCHHTLPHTSPHLATCHHTLPRTSPHLIEQAKPKVVDCLGLPLGQWWLEGYDLGLEHAQGYRDDDSIGLEDAAAARLSSSSVYLHTLWYKGIINNNKMYVGTFITIYGVAYNHIWSGL